MIALVMRYRFNAIDGQGKIVIGNFGYYYRNGLAVVPVERDACGGCFNAIPPQRQSEIKQRKKIIVCENCGRILVDRDLFDSIDVK